MTMEVVSRPARPLGRLVLAVSLVLASLVGFAAPASATRIERVVSPRGIEAWLVEEHAVPLIAVDFSFEGGSTQDPAGKEGLADLLSTLLDEGAGDLKSEAFQRRLEDLSIRMSFHDERDRFGGELRTLTAHRDAAFDLLALALTKPRFDDEAVERMRVQAVAGLRRSLKNPEAIAGRLAAAAMFPDHPYGRPSQGTEQSVDRIAIADLKSFHRNVFARAGLKIAVVGDIDAATLAPLLDRVFADLPEKGHLVAVPEVTPKVGVRVSETMEVPQAVIRLGGIGLKRSDPDFVAAYVMNHILGGGTFSSWLYAEVRERRGLAYSVATGLVPYQHAGVFVGAVGTRPEKVDEVVSVMTAEIARMRDQGPSEAELAAAKAYLIGSYPLRFDTSGKIAGGLLAIQEDDLGIDYIDERNGLIEAVTVADVKRVAERLFATPATIVTVGPATAAPATPAAPAKP